MVQADVMCKVRGYKAVTTHIYGSPQWSTTSHHSDIIHSVLLITNSIACVRCAVCID